MIIEFTKLVMHSAIAHHLQTDAQPDSEQWFFPPVNSSSLYTDHDSIWYGISFWPVWVAYLAMLPPSFLCTSSVWQRMGS